jgi:hypothetical protein
MASENTGPCGPCVPSLPSPWAGPAAGIFPGGGGGIPGTAGAVGVVTNPVVTPGPGGGLGPVPVTPRGPAAVNLATAGLFEILTKSGITNVPTSSVIGDMGVSPITDAAITGFALVLDGSGQFSTSAQVTGKVYAANYTPPTPAKLTQAVLDMQAAYTDAQGRSPDVVNLAGGSIGGLTLAPGTYQFTSNLSVLSGITFNGGPNDTWIIQVAGTLTIGNGVNIQLTGGAQAKNIIWAVAGATTIGTGVIFQGNVLDQTNIAVQTGAIVHGKLLAQTAVTLQQNTVGP